MGNIDRFHTFSVDQNGDLMDYDDDYYHGEVKSEAKFIQPRMLDLYVTTF